jgi:uncharacterized protein YjbI with pentapeptide repeats
MSVDWETCAEGSCKGVQLPTGGKCWAHADDQDLDAALQQLGEGGDLDLRGVRLIAELLQRLLAGAPKNAQGHTSLKNARFHQATFLGDAKFDGVTFEGEAGFTGATFEDTAAFAGASFEGWAGFYEATFKRMVRFDWATFGDMAVFDRVTFEDIAVLDGVTFKGRAGFGDATLYGGAGFSGATFEAIAVFDRATFGHIADFDRATFKDPADFNRVTFEDVARFEGTAFYDMAEFSGATFQDRAAFHKATFQSWAGFDQTTFQGDAEFGSTFEGWATFNGTVFQRGTWFGGAMFPGGADFDSATFERARQFGPLFARQLTLDYAVFRERVQIEVIAAALCARRAQFPSGVQLRLRWASVVLDDASLATPAILTGVPPFAGFDEEDFAGVWRRLPPARVRDGRPRLLSLRRADVAGLAVANADLRACRFLGAHNLDKLRVEGDAAFGYTPSPWWWTTRQTIAEEHQWRASRAAAADATPTSARHDGWYPAHYRPPDWLEVETVTPAQLATLYRALRKGREDNKDEPGAADFYYGEMEMRRHARHEQARQERRRGHWGTWAAARAEHAILWLYWLVSGYALRAWRAFAALLLVIVVAAGIFAAVGFKPPEARRFVPVGVSSTGTLVYQEQHVKRRSTWDQFPGALGYSAEVATSLLRAPERPVTAAGEWTQAILRWLGPLLFGLAIFSLRGRVKR